MIRIESRLDGFLEIETRQRCQAHVLIGIVSNSQVVLKYYF